MMASTEAAASAAASASQSWINLNEITMFCVSGRKLKAESSENIGGWQLKAYLANCQLHHHNQLHWNGINWSLFAKETSLMSFGINLSKWIIEQLQATQRDKCYIE